MEKIIKTVYSLVYPETEQVLTELWKTNPLHLFSKAYEGTQETIHEDFKQQWLKWTAPVLTLSQDLTNFYPTAGSSEAIRESLAQYASKHPRKAIHVFEGDYEGYFEFAKVYNIPVIKHNRNDFSTLKDIKENEKFYISQPSSLDGNVWECFPRFVSHLEKNNIPVELMVDVCYIGTVAKDYQVDLTSKLVHTAFFSLSKVFGVYYHRIGGVFSKEPMLGLYGNRWFKNVFSLTFGTELMKRYSVRELPNKYALVKEQIISKINTEHNSNFKASDVMMLLHSSLDSDLAKQHQRVDIARVCITPLLDEAIREKS